jgi:CCR4-NOT complex subunit CAF16
MEKNIISTSDSTSFHTHPGPPSSSLFLLTPSSLSLPTTSSKMSQPQPPYIDQTLAPSISVRNLTYLFPNKLPGLNSVSLSLPPRSRTLLIGANGAGKTTLLRLLSGKRLAPSGTIQVGGLDPFKDGLEGVTYLGLEWVLNPIVRTDIGVRELLKSVGGDHYPERKDELVQVLDIDLDWRMHAVSDGERRRVQLAMGLVRPWRILLLDEITVDLDLLSRSNFLAFLKKETEERQCTIVYATHILDNLAEWPSHLVHMSMGKVKEWGAMREFDVNGTPETGNSRLGELVLGWLKEDLVERGPRNRGVGSEGTAYITPGIGGYGQEDAEKKRTGWVG